MNIQSESIYGIKKTNRHFHPPLKRWVFSFNCHKWKAVTDISSFEELSNSIQGIHLSKDLLKQAIKPEEGADHAGNLINNWIDQVTDNEQSTAKQQLQQFLYAVTGSTTLSPGKKIIVNQSSELGCEFYFSTCTRSLYVLINGDSNLEKNFNMRLTAAIQGNDFSGG